MFGLLFAESLAWSCFSVGGLLGSQTIIDSSLRKVEVLAGAEGLNVVLMINVSVWVSVALGRLFCV